MLSFYYDCIDKLCDRSNFEVCEMDTDSLYMGISGSDFEQIIKKKYLNSYRK